VISIFSFSCLEKYRIRKIAIFTILKHLSHRSMDENEKQIPDDRRLGHSSSPHISPRHDGSSIASRDKDIAAALVSEHAQHIDPAVERRVLRKIDVYFIPLMWIGYGFVYYDKVPPPLRLTTTI